MKSPLAAATHDCTLLCLSHGDLSLYLSAFLSACPASRNSSCMWQLSVHVYACMFFLALLLGPFPEFTCLSLPFLYLHGCLNILLWRVSLIYCPSVSYIPFDFEASCFTHADFCMCPLVGVKELTPSSSSNLQVGKWKFDFVILRMGEKHN